MRSLHQMNLSLIAILLVSLIACSGPKNSPSDDGQLASGVVGGFSATAPPYFVSLVYKMEPHRWLVRDRNFRDSPLDFQNPRQYPFWGKDWVPRCGGSLIANGVVLTAAHCVNRSSVNEIGLSFFAPKGWLQTEKYEPIKVSTIRIHPRSKDQLDSPQFANTNWLPGLWNQALSYPRPRFDLALLFFDPLLQPTEAKPIQLNRDPLVPQPGDFVTITGLGLMSGYGELRLSHLQQAVIPVIDAAVADDRWLRVSGDSAEETELVAADIENFRRVNRGDSGGGLTLQSKNGEILVGITSFGAYLSPNVGFDSLESVGVFERVSSHIDWIEKEKAKHKELQNKLRKESQVSGEVLIQLWSSHCLGARDTVMQDIDENSNGTQWYLGLDHLEYLGETDNWSSHEDLVEVCSVNLKGERKIKFKADSANPGKLYAIINNNTAHLLNAVVLPQRFAMTCDNLGKEDYHLRARYHQTGLWTITLSPMLKDEKNKLIRRVPDGIYWTASERQDLIKLIENKVDEGSSALDSDLTNESTKQFGVELEAVPQLQCENDWGAVEIVEIMPRDLTENTNLELFRDFRFFNLKLVKHRAEEAPVIELIGSVRSEPSNRPSVSPFSHLFPRIRAKFEPDPGTNQISEEVGQQSQNSAAGILTLGNQSVNAIRTWELWCEHDFVLDGLRSQNQRLLFHHIDHPLGIFAPNQERQFQFAFEDSSVELTSEQIFNLCSVNGLWLKPFEWSFEDEPPSTDETQ